jgi:hypothetical protein
VHFYIDGLHRVQRARAGLVIVIAFCPRFLVLMASSPREAVGYDHEPSEKPSDMLMVTVNVWRDVLLPTYLVCI